MRFSGVEPNINDVLGTATDPENCLSSSGGANSHREQQRHYDVKLGGEKAFTLRLVNDSLRGCRGIGRFGDGF